MATAIRIEALPARLGDCILVECLRDGERPWRMLIDGGPPDTWPLLDARLRRLDDPHIDVAVVTHIDSDHIGGFLPFVSSAHSAHVADFWFNARRHLPRERSATRSPAQGETLTASLLGLSPDAAGGAATRIEPPTAGAALPWNVAFGGGPIESGETDGFREVEVIGGPRITVLSPTTARLAILEARWLETIGGATRGESGPRSTDAPPPIGDLAALAGEVSPKDASAPNGSSIALLVEHRGASVLLSGDAFGTVLGTGLNDLANARGVEAIEVDAFKLPHHGSRGNVLTPLLARAPARHYIVSTNGDTFHHPDDVAMARAVLQGGRDATFWFNYRTPRAERWAAPALRDAYGYDVRFPDDDAAGAVVELEERV